MLLRDPHPLRLEVIRSVLERSGMRVLGATASSEELLVLLAHEKPSVAVVGLTGGGELDLLDEIRATAPGVRLVVLADSADEADIEDAFARGSCAYVLGSARTEDVALAVRQAFDHSVFTRTVGRRTVPVRDPGDKSELTTRELEVLRLVAEGRSNAEVAAQLGIAAPTIKFHLASIFRKLGVTNRTAAATWALRSGLVRRDG